jgi:hypothetical protein
LFDFVNIRHFGRSHALNVETLGKRAFSPERGALLRKSGRKLERSNAPRSVGTGIGWNGHPPVFIRVHPCPSVVKNSDFLRISGIRISDIQIVPIRG